MREKDILQSIKKSIDQAPIDILENIKNIPRTKMLRHDEITEQKREKNTFKKFMPYASIAAAFIMIFFGWQFQTQMADSHIYLDVNPSVEITTNRINKVIDLEAYNQEGKLLTENVKYKGMTIEQVAEEILDRMMDRKYLDKNNKFLLVSVYNKSEEKAEAQKLDLDTKIHQHFQNKELKPIVLSQKLDNTSTIENYAKQFGVSVSKMTFIRNLIILNPELQTGDLVDLSIGDLVRLSQGMGLQLDKILDSIDFDRIEIEEDNPKEEPVTVPEAESKSESQPEPKAQPKPLEPTRPVKDQDDEEDDDHHNEGAEQDNIISPEQARNIALSVANGTITDFDFDEDDLEYEVEIEFGELEYEIIIDARTGAVLEVEIDD